MFTPEGKMRRLLLFLSACLALQFQPARVMAQFSFEQIKDDADFEFEAPVSYFTNPRFNRVEGLFLNAGVQVHPVKIPRFQLHADFGIGFWNEDTDQKFRFNAGARKDFGDFNRSSIGLDVFRKLDSEDDWFVGEVENSIASFLFREDFKDYYGVTGFSFFVDHKINAMHTLRLEVGRRNYDVLKRNIDWSVFGGSFDENPKRLDSAIADGNEISVKLIAVLDWRDNPVFPISGWYFQSIYEHTAEDFDTDGLFLTAKRYQPTVSNQRLVVRALLGSRTGSAAEQYTMDLGGLGSLRAFDDKELNGNRMFLLNANYLFGGGLLQRIPLQNLPFFGAFWTTLSAGVFIDTGWVDRVNVDDGLFSGFGGLTLDNLETDIGFSLLVLDGVLRMDVARRTNSDPGRDDYRITFRLLENF